MKFFFLAGFCFLVFTVNSQYSLQIGSREFPGLSTNTYGIMNSWSGVAPFARGNHHATIYPLQSIGLMGVGQQITALRFYRDVLSAQPTPGSLQETSTFKLYIKNTPLTTFSSAVTWQDTANTMTEIFNGDPTTIVGSATGWITFLLPTPHTYDGTNLMLLMEYWQTSAATPSIVWSYDQSSVSPQILVNYFDATQNRYNAPVTSLPFPASTTGSNIRHPSIQILYSDAPIPVKLVSFDGIKKTRSIQLNWLTALETGSTLFELQKSNDAINWKKIGSIPALNHPNGASYSYTDENPLLFNYYRLKMIEDNGKITYSANKLIKFTGNTSFRLQPTPATTMLQINFAEQTVSNLQVINSEGVILKQEGIQNKQNCVIDISLLPAGLYLVRDLHSMQVKKFIKF